MVPQNRPDDQPSRALSRRAALAGLGTGATVALSGCTVDLNRSIDEPAIDERERSTIHEYYDDGDRIGSVTVSDNSSPEHHRWRYPIQFSVWHRDDLTVDRLTCRFRPLGTDTPPEFYLQRPVGDPPDGIRFTRDEDGEATVLEVPDLGEQGRGTVIFELLLAVSEDSVPLRVEYEVSMDADGILSRGYELDDAIERTYPGQAALAGE